MKKIYFNPNDLDGDEKKWWVKWSKKAETKTQEILNIFETKGKVVSDDFTSSVWGELKEWMLEHIFHGKCAYCEIGKGRFSFHAEHFRPKGGIKNKDDNGKLFAVKSKTPKDVEIDHPGYFWLAYDWKNLLPSCEFCNTRLGKKNQFPADEEHVFVKKIDAANLAKFSPAPIKCKFWGDDDYYFLKSEDLDKLEKRQLLHPLFDTPEEHLKFGEGGTVVPKSDSDVGKISIAVYTLDERNLEGKRQMAQTFLFLDYQTRLSNLTIKDKNNLTHLERKNMVKEELIKEIKQDSEREYSSALLDYLKYTPL